MMFNPTEMLPKTAIAAYKKDPLEYFIIPQSLIQKFQQAVLSGGYTDACVVGKDITIKKAPHIHVCGLYIPSAKANGAWVMTDEETSTLATFSQQQEASIVGLLRTTAGGDAVPTAADMLHLFQLQKDVRDCVLVLVPPSTSGQPLYCGLTKQGAAECDAYSKHQGSYTFLYQIFYIYTYIYIYA